MANQEFPSFPSAFSLLKPLPSSCHWSFPNRFQFGTAEFESIFAQINSLNFQYTPAYFITKDLQRVVTNFITALFILPFLFIDTCWRCMRDYIMTSKTDIQAYF